jgi:hypothetical protein
VELTCHRCGAPVEEGVAFCHCGAPQIRVSVEPGVPLPPPVESPVLELPLSTEEASGPRLLPIAIFAGLLEALFTFFGIGIFTGGLVSVALYRRRNLGKDLNSGLGARLGLVSGAVGFGVFAVVRAMEMTVTHAGPELRAQVMKALEQRAEYPAAQAQQMMQYLQSAQGWALFVALLTIFTLLAFLLISTLGGVIGAVVLKRRGF